jgi:hypothetical protein
MIAQLRGPKARCETMIAYLAKWIVARARTRGMLYNWLSSKYLQLSR